MGEVSWRRWQFGLKKLLLCYLLDGRRRQQQRMELRWVMCAHLSLLVIIILPLIYGLNFVLRRHLILPVGVGCRPTVCSSADDDSPMTTSLYHLVVMLGNGIR